jgi:alkyl hydroperoxide reductase subunit AhpC
LQLTSESKVATPANWKDGDDVVISPSIPDHDTRKFPKGSAQKLIYE